MQKSTKDDLAITHKEAPLNEYFLSKSVPPQETESKLKSPHLLDHLSDIQESESDMNAVDYDDLTSYSKYNIGESGTEERSCIYEKYAKTLQKRVRVKLERKTAIACVKALTEEKTMLESQLKTIRAQRQQKNSQIRQSLESQIENTRVQLRFQSQLKECLHAQFQALCQFSELSESTIESYPRDKMASYLALMQSESQSIKTSGIKITLQLDLQQVLLQNLEDIINELP